MDSRHKEFLDGLSRSQIGVQTISQWLTSKNIDVLIYGYTQAEDHTEAQRNSDSGDMCIIRDGVEEMCEVKWLTTKFTCKDDWPYRDFIVNRKSSHDRVVSDGRDPQRYFLLNSERTHVGIVEVSTSDHWTERMVKNGKVQDGKPYMGYICPIKLVTFRRVVV